MRLLDRFKRRDRRVVPDMSVSAHRMPPQPPLPEAPPPARVEGPRPAARPAMRLMLADGTMQDLEDPEMEERAEYLIKAMLPPAPPPPPVSS